MDVDVLNREPDERDTLREQAAMDQLRAIAERPQDYQLGEEASTGIPPRTSNVEKHYKNASTSHTDKNSHSIGRAAAGTATSVSGTVIKTTGKGVGAVGKGTRRTGAVLSRTGIGAVVGVPLMAAGTAVQVTGRGLERTGRGVERGGKRIRTKNQPPPKYNSYDRFRQPQWVRSRLEASGGDENATVRSKAKIRSTALYWVDLVLIVPVVSIFNALFIYFYSAYSDVEEDGVLGIAYDAAVSLVTLNPIEAVSEAGVKIGYYLNPEPFMGMMVGVWFFGATISVVFLLIALDALQSTGAQTKNSMAKEGLFLAAFVCAFVPFVNIFPWTALWVRHVGKHPE